MSKQTIAVLGAAFIGAAIGMACGASNATKNAIAAPSASAAAMASASAPPAAKSAPIDEKAVATATNGKTEAADGNVKVSFPRTDVAVEVDGSKLAPFAGLTSWVAFTPGKPGVEAMMMGDLVLFEDEVNPVLSVLLDNGVEVTALHNHFLYAKPSVFFMHVNGEGKVESLGKGIKLAVEKTAEIRKKSPKPAEKSGAPPLAAKSAIDAAKLDAVFGVKGMAKDGMYKATMGRAATASCGCAIGKMMGVSTWAAFQGTDDAAAVDGDFAVTESEMQPVLKALRAGNIDVVAIHSHMTGENPRILFMHYWGRGKTSDLSAVLKKALDLTAWDGKTKGA